MSLQKYSKLIDALCELGKVAPSAERYEQCELVVDGTAFTLMPSTLANGRTDAAAYFVDLGPLPEDDPGKAIALLSTNLYMVGRDAPVFCCEPQTRRAVLAGRIPLDMSVEAVRDLLAGFADFAKDWQTLDASPPSSAGPAVARPKSSDAQQGLAPRAADLLRRQVTR